MDCMSDMYIVSLNSQQEPHDVGTFVSSIFQMKKLRQRRLVTY